jgi:hypothetical protein
MKGMITLAITELVCVACSEGAMRSDSELALASASASPIAVLASAAEHAVHRTGGMRASRIGTPVIWRSGI